MRKAVIALVVAIVVLIGLDRGGWAVTNYALEGQLKTQLKLDKKPKARVHGIPFLTQVIGGKYDNIEVDAKDVSAGRLAHVDADVHLHGAHVPLGKLLGWNIDKIPVDHATAQVTVPYSELARLSDVPGLTAKAHGDAVTLTAPLTGLGTVTAVATPKLTGNVVSVQPSSASVNGRPLPVALVGRLAYRLPVDSLPFQLKLTGLHVTADGLTGSATADHITIRRGQLIPAA